VIDVNLDGESVVAVRLLPETDSLVILRKPRKTDDGIPGHLTVMMLTFGEGVERGDAPWS
jgi:hypothetical protein